MATSNKRIERTARGRINRPGLLVSAQAKAAVVLRQSLQHTAADILLTSHKEAAAILLDARLQVIDAWKGNETAPGSTTGAGGRLA